LVTAVKSDLQKNKKLNYHYYESLIKALYKTNAWFKGILFQFCDKEANLREVKVIESLLTKMTIPVISSSVALIKMTEMAPCSAVLHYLKALVGKNYSFPKKVLSVLASYLIQFEKVEEDMPVLWHQFFLTIVKQYGSSLDEMSKASLAELTKNKHHKLISPEILKLLS
jgi:essential nuclear protein 1